LTAGYVGDAQAEEFVSAGFNLPGSISAAVSFDCSNSPGPWITLGDGRVDLGSVGAELTLSNNAKLTHSTDPGDILLKERVQLNFGATIQIPKQPSRPVTFPGGTGTGVGGNPRIYVAFYDPHGKPLKNAAGDELGYLCLGRCVQGAANINASFLEAVLAATTVSTDHDSCTNNPGPYITINEGILSLSGVSARIIFTNNAKFTHQASGDGYVDFTLIPANGLPIVLPKQPSQDGVTGNPIVYFIFLKNDEYVGTWPGQSLGRCNKI